MQEVMADDSGAMAADMPGCEMMTAASGEHGKSKSSLCKVTAQCQIGSLYHPVSSPSVVRPAGSFIPLSFHYAESFSFRAPDGLWRPPQSL